MAIRRPQARWTDDLYMLAGISKLTVAKKRKVECQLRWPMSITELP